MAKQNVGFGERHLEKFVVGVAGAVLAAMAFLYVVQDPYSIDVDGETLGPNAFYPLVDEKATALLNTLKNAPPKEVPVYKPPVASAQRIPDLAMVFAPLNPPVPGLDSQIDLGEKVELVGILPPGKPALTSGRAYTTLPSFEVKLIGEAQQNRPSESSAEPAEDCHWIAVFASVPRRSQQEAFLKGKYAVERQLLIVTSVEAERQRLLPNGEWDKSQKVGRTFSPLILSGRQTVDLKKEDLSEESKFIDLYQQEATKAQREILRPAFQGILPPESQLDWTVPAEMPDGAKFDWLQDYGVAMPAPDEATPADGEAAAAPRLDYRKTKAEIDELIKQGKFIEADRKVQDTLNSNANLPPNQKKELDALLAQLEPKVLQETRNTEAARTRRAAIESATLGADVDLLWVTDLSAVPGETYRYRVRVWALNPHAGLARKLRNPEDAEKVVLPGEWSDWSDPLSLKPEKYLFCTGIDQDQVKIELNQWGRGEWDKTSQVLALGRPIAFQDKLKDFTYDAVATAIAPAPYEQRTVDRRGRIRYQDPKDTFGIAFVRSDGQVEEHLVQADVDLKRLLQDELSPRKDAPQRRALTPQNRDYAPRGPQMGPGGRTRGFRDEG
jgi:hypothetical protein